MLWLQTPPWAKWISVGLIFSVAMWLELRPDPRVDHPFAVVDIAPGEVLGPHNTETRRVPSGMLELPPEDARATEPIPAGTPALAAYTAIGDHHPPDGWWIVSTPIPAGAAVGDAVKLIMLDTGSSVDGIVTSLSVSDAFSTVDGGVAVPEQSATEVAVAVANGRIAVLLSAR